MHANQRLLNHFYAAFERLDAEAMGSCYAPDARFEDEVFTLRGQEEVAGMWRMLCAATREKGADVWKLSASGVEAGAISGQAHWVADYRFSATGRLVHNVIDSSFEFNPEGLIQRQRDTFDLWAWSRQALGAPGLLLGWTPFLRRKIRAQAAANLQKFITRRKA
jgi:hypothetical protein